VLLAEAAASAPPPRPEESALRFAFSRVVDVLSTLDARGGLGLDVHANLEREIALARRALSAPPPGEERGPMTWGVSTDEESFHGHYATKEEALAAAQSELALAPGQRFWVGGGGLWRPGRCGDADRILEYLAESAGDDCGEIAEDWLSDVSREDKEALESDLHAVVMAWLRRTGNLPAFYCCETTEEHTYQPALRAALREDEKGAKP
jgi:hypothetical protein